MSSGQADTNVNDPVFTFAPRWREELVCTCPLGELVLEMPMGVLSVYLPTEEVWSRKAPAWAGPHWAAMHAQLTAWCRANRLPLYLDDVAPIFGL